MKKVVYMFWIGDASKIRKQKQDLEAQGIKVVVGPSKEDDKFLCDNVKYYKLSKDKKIFAFCSDVWRFYILSKNSGLYIDANESIGKDFYKYFEDFSCFDIALTRSSSHTIGSSFLYSNGHQKHIFQEAFDIYKSFDSKWPRISPISPNVITWVMRKYYSPGYDLEINKKIAFYSFLIIRDKKKYFKMGHASWSKGFDAAKSSQNLENIFTERTKTDSKSTSKYYSYDKFPKFEIGGLRDQYDLSSSKKELMELRNIYKSIPNKIFWKEWLIWSKLYRFFTFKKAT